MNLTITDQKEEPLLSRKEIIAEITFDKATPSKEEVKKAIAAQLKADESLIVVKNIYTEFGTPKAKSRAYIYSSKKDMDNIEPKKKVHKEAKPAAEKSEAKKSE